MWSCRVGQVYVVGNIPSCICIHTIIFHGIVGVSAALDLDKTYLNIRRSLNTNYKELVWMDILIPDDIISYVYNTTDIPVISEKKLLKNALKG